MVTGQVNRTFLNALLELDRLQVDDIVRSYLSSAPAVSLIEDMIAPVLDEIGRAWEKGDVALSQVYMSSRICESLIDSLLPPESHQRKESPRIA